MYDLLVMFHTIWQVIDEDGHLQEFHNNFGEPISNGIEFMQHMCERDPFKREESVLYVLKIIVKVDILDLDLIVSSIDNKPQMPHGPLLDCS